MDERWGVIRREVFHHRGAEDTEIFTTEDTERTEDRTRPAYQAQEAPALRRAARVVERGTQIRFCVGRGTRHPALDISDVRETGVNRGTHIVHSCGG
jgi:hypothetical protein